MTVSASLRHVLGTFAILAMMAVAGPVSAQQQTPPAASPQRERAIDPDTRAVNEEILLREMPRIQGSILIPDQRESVLIQPAGRVWDHFHEVQLRPIGMAVIFGMMVLLAISYAALGRMRISTGRSGVSILRFTTFERLSHWLTATSFVLLALTGLNITFGKVALLPLLGPDAFSTFAQYAKYIHNYVSFAFVIGLVLIATLWMKDNIPRKIDLTWLKEGGGFVGAKHPTAGRFNAGEKLVFWFALAAGAAVAVSGYLLIFPFYVTDIAGMQVAQVVHSLIAVLFIAVIIAHIYIGTLGMEGAFEAMGTGSVDLNWAKEHHHVWYEDEVRKGRVPQQHLAAPPAEISGLISLTPDQLDT
jgi:formate dehydrogenase subunit gamma